MRATTLLAALMFLLISLSMTRPSVQTGQRPGIIIPLYTYPTDRTWSRTIQIKHAYPYVPIIVIMNPASGPGDSLDPNYVSGVKRLQLAGITVLGYDHTSYTARPLSTVETDVRKYVQWYHVNGIFFDEMADDGAPKEVTYYKALEAYAISEGLTMTVGNPATPVAVILIGIFNVLCIYEGTGMPPTSDLNRFKAYGPAGFYFIAYSLTTFPSSQVLSDLQYVNWIYVTDAGGSNPYNKLPTYFSPEIAFLNTA